MNRVGDMFLSVAFFAIFFVFGNMDYNTVFSISPFINETRITIIGLLLLLAAMGKSAQIGLHTWLPDAMEGWVYIGAFLLYTFALGSSSSLIIEVLSITLTPLLLSVPKSTLGSITGCMLGDGSIRSSTNSNNSKGNARYNITMKETSQYYMEYLRTMVFSAFKPSPLNPYPNLLLSKHVGKTVQQYHFSTRSVSFFTELHALWYVWDNNNKKYKKIVPLVIHSLFTVESLVHWIIGYFDGNGRTKTVLLCTESFTKEECILLQQVLLHYNIVSTLKVRNKEMNTYRIRVSKTSMPTLKSLVLPMMPSQFHYKLGISSTT